jgi:hypothetical protein
VTSADLGYIRLAERSISRCGTHQALCDRLKYPGTLAIVPWMSMMAGTLAV